MFILERQHKGALQEAARVFTNRHRIYETRLLPVYQHCIITIQQGVTKFPPEQQAEIDAIRPPVQPIQELPQTQFTPAMDMKLSR